MTVYADKLTGGSKVPGCKARAVMKNEAYVLYAAVKHGKRNAADGYF